MEMLIWIGAAISVVGLIGLVWSVLRVLRAKRTAKDDEALRDAVKQAVPLNVGAFFLSMFGLTVVIVGIVLT